MGNDLTYNNSLCFERYPFPESQPNTDRIGLISADLDAHRKRQQSLYPDLTITGMYNVLEKASQRRGVDGERKSHPRAGARLRPQQIHDDLDAAVFDAYGWPHDLTDEQILERLVALNAERAEEERRGIIRWLRPEFQNPAGAKGERQTTMAGIEIEEKETEAKPTAAVAWPKDLPSQISAVRDLVTGNRGESWTVERTAKAFKGAKRPQVQSVLDSLAALGLLVSFGEGAGREWRSGG
ncbi:MAG TPA: RNA-binding protein [Thermoanaerobaculia bacterium]